MELYQLRYFLAVAETANFTKAAARSNISQPSLSQQILNLEAETGQKLFHRLGRRVALTQAGELLLEHAREIVARADNVLRELKDDPTGGFKVSVGALPTVAHFFFPAVVAHCRANQVPLMLETHENFRPVVVSAVLGGEVDLGLVSTPVNEAQLESTVLYREPLLLAISANHRLVGSKELTFADLREEAFIMLGDTSTLTSQVRRVSVEYGFEPRVGHQCAQLATLKSLTAMGLGISILPRSARSPNDPAGLVYRKFTGISPTREIALVRHQRRHLGKGARLFAEAARAVVGPPPAAERSSGAGSSPVVAIGETS